MTIDIEANKGFFWKQKRSRRNRITAHSVASIRETLVSIAPVLLYDVVRSFMLWIVIFGCTIPFVIMGVLD